MTLADLRALLSNGNVSAFLRVIRARESSQDDSAYTILNGGTHFSGFADHPYKGQRTPPAKAAGAFQFIASTWAEVKAQYGIVDFGPMSQTLGAVARIIYRGALDDVLAGRFESAVVKCRKEWTSLPGAAESSGSWTMDKARAVYLQYGGTLTRQDSQVTTTYAPELASKNPMRKVMDPLSLVSMLASVFSPMLRAKVESAVGTDVGKPLVDNLLGMATQLTGKSDPLEAVAVARQSPQVVAQLEQSASDWFAQVAPMLDKLAQYDKDLWQAENEGKRTVSQIAIDERKAGLWDMTKTVVWFAASTLTALILALLGALIYQSVTGERQIDSGLLGLAGPIFMATVAAWGAIIAFRFDGTKDSSAQNAAMAAIATRTEVRK